MKKYLVLDRDGTLNHDSGYVYKVSDLIILPGVIEGLKKFRDEGWNFLVVTNQAGIAKSFFTINDLFLFHRHLQNVLYAHGINIEAFYHCSHHPNITGDCQCRKPKIGLVTEAAQKLGFKPEQSIFIGDKDSDIQLGLNCGGLTVLIENGQYPNKVQPHFRAKDIDNAFELLKISGHI